MEVTTEVVDLGKTQCLIFNGGPDDLYVGEMGQPEADWFTLSSGSALTVDANNEVGVVSDGVSEVGILYGGTGIFPPAVEIEEVDLSGYLLKVDAFEQAQGTNPQTGTSYTLVAGDVGKLVTLSNAAAITLTVPQDSDAVIPVGSYVDLYQLGAGQVTVQAGTGATLRVSGLTAKARAQYARLGLQKVSANTWSLFGDLAAS